jgi:PKHD-type hydroxylase
MRMKQWYWVSDSPLPEDLCDQIVAAGEKLKLGEGKVKSDPTGTVRQSEVGWFNRTADTWLLEPLRAKVDQANEELWGWTIDTVQSVQYTTYTEGSHYSWHTDQHLEPYTDERWPGTIRKLSVTVQLSEGDAYEGGDFEIEALQGTPDKAGKRVQVIDELRHRGNVLVFPSHLYHRVTPVTGGQRNSVVAWYLGPPFV